MAKGPSPGTRHQALPRVDSSPKLRHPDTGSVEGIAGETGGRTDNGEEKLACRNIE